MSNLCLGAMMFGTFGNPDHEDSIGIIHAALDAGINFVDTADMYSAGESEEIVGKALQGRRDDVILATKVFMPMSRDRNHRGNSRRWIIRECEDSLRRLQTDWIDLYQVHRPDVYTNIDETLGALSDLIHQGKVRYIGSSTFPSEEIVEAQWVAERRGRERFISEQPPYSIFARGIEAGILPVCQRYEMGVLTWSPLNSGWLTGRYRSGATADPEGRSARTPEQFDPAVETNQRKLALVDELLDSGRRRRCASRPRGPGLRPSSSRGERGHHRAADDGTAGEPASRLRPGSRQCHHGPHRRLGTARNQCQH